MLHLSIIDSLSLAGSHSRVNEDQMGWNAHCAFVIDGATGLGQDFIAGAGESDAAWLAAFARIHFEEMIVPGRPIPDIVRMTNTLACKIVEFAAGDRIIPAWNLPVAAFQMIRIEEDCIRLFGLGDCSAFLRDAHGKISTHTALPGMSDRERQTARAAIDRAGGLSRLGAPAGDPELLNGIRAQRASYNTSSGKVWMLGAAPDAGDHLAQAGLRPEYPLCGILCSDGFAALVTDYEKYDIDGLIAAAREQGLSQLARELREIEQVRDPDGIAYPRMKVSDDATAVLFEITRAGI